MILRADAEERVHVRRGDLGGKTGVVFKSQGTIGCDIFVPFLEG